MDSPSSSSSSSSSIQTFSCKWEWCSSTFPDKATLSQHVIEHARNSIPIRRRDIALLRRAEEGSGESENFTQLVQGYLRRNHATNTIPSFSSFDDSPAHTPLLAIPLSPSFKSLVNAGINPHHLSQTSSESSRDSVANLLTAPPEVDQAQSRRSNSLSSTSTDGSSASASDTSSGSSKTSTVANSDSEGHTPKVSYATFPIHHHGHKSLARVPTAFPEDPLSKSSFASSDSKKTTLPSAKSEVKGTRSSPRKLGSPLKFQSNKPESIHADVKTSTKKKRIFRSGTLKLTQFSQIPETVSPENSQENMAHLPVQTLSQEMHDRLSEFNETPDYPDSQSYEENSYPPLQTQAPYSSQIMTQY